MKRLFALCLCAILLCAVGCQKQEMLPPEEFFTPEIYPPAQMPKAVPIETQAEEVDLLRLDAPPALTVLCGGGAVENSSPGFTWVNTMPDGQAAALVACGPHPLDMKENLTVFETAEETVRLVFEYAPDELYVNAWDDSNWGNYDAVSQSVVLNNGEAELLPGGYIYEVTAKWGDGETSGGTGRYVFYVNKLYPGNE